MDAFTFRRVLLVLSKPAAEPGQNFYNEVHAGNFMMDLPFRMWMHGGIKPRLKELHPSTIPRLSPLKTGLGAYVTSCSLIRPAFFGASGKTFPRYGR
jgi:hypothetical protein